MPRIARVVVPRTPHHVTQRGNNRQDVFFVDDDRRAYLKILAVQCRLHRVKLLGYCLMTNHVHLIPVPATTDGLARAIGRTHWLYTQYINRMHGRSGHLWQNRFYSSPLDDRHALLAMRYAEWNPIRAGLCRVAQRYRWSSAAAHCTATDGAQRRASDNDVVDVELWRELSAGLNWAKELKTAPTPAETARLRRCTHTGRPLASNSWLSKLEKKLGRRLRALPVGRPREAKDEREGRKSSSRRQRRSGENR
jgi:putative transposase